MKPKTTTHSVHDFAAAFIYDPDDGTFTRRKTGRGISTRNAAGYVVLSFCGRQYYAHRVAMFLQLGEWPELVDHINGDKADNRLCNLRLASKSENAVACRKTCAASGTKGVYSQANTSKWRVRVRTPDGSNKHVGYFSTIAEAEATHRAIHREMYGAFSPYSGPQIASEDAPSDREGGV